MLILRPEMTPVTSRSKPGRSFALDENRRAEDVLALQFWPAHRDATLGLPFQ